MCAWNLGALRGAVAPMHSMRAILGLLAVLAACPTANSAELPAQLNLEYTFSYEGIELGRASKTLRRSADGRYRHSVWVRPTGMARALTSVTWQEDGEFEIHGKEIRPLRFKETRKGDKRAYEHEAHFDYAKKKLKFINGESVALALGTQDQGSIVYSMMLDPLTAPGRRSVMVTDGHEVEPYRLEYVGTETLRTPLGRLDTIVIKRLSARQVERERECRAQQRGEDDCPIDDFLVWIAPSKANVAVKLQKRKKQRTMTLVLHAIEGL